MKYRIYFLIFLLLVSCQRNADTFSLEGQIQQLHDEGLFNGAIIVTEGDSVVLSKGFGYANFESQVPFETNTPMDTGSITKTFTALAMLMLANSKEIDLNTPVNSFIKEFPYKSITIRHLLEQTSGIVSEDYVFESVQQGVAITNTTFLDFLVQDAPELEFVPGSQFMYNGLNHRLLAILIENIGKVSYEEFITRKIAGPLHLEDWFLRPARLEDLPKNRALGYTKKKGTLQPFDSEDFEAFYGDCNLFFSAEDLSKWAKSFISNSLDPKHSSTIALKSKSSLSEFNILHWYNLDGRQRYHFTGDWKGFYTMVYFDIDKKRSIIHLTNTNMDHWLKPTIVRNIDHYLNNGSIPDWQPPKPLGLKNEEITGSYYLDENRVAQISNDSGTLKIDANGKSVGLYRLDSDFYYAPGIDLWVWFSKDDEENLTIHCSSIYQLNKGFKKSSQHGP